MQNWPKDLVHSALFILAAPTLRAVRTVDQSTLGSHPSVGGAPGLPLPPGTGATASSCCLCVRSPPEGEEILPLKL